jgi:YVTN family beta-propeller protein
MVGFPDTIVWGVPTGAAPFDIEMLPNGQRVYVTNSGSNSLSVISGSDHSVLTYISVGANPRGITALPNSMRVYVMINGEDYVLSQPVYGGATEIIPVPDPLFAAAHPSGEYVYVASPSTGNVYVIRTSDNTVVDSVFVGGAPATIEANPNGINLYVSDASSCYVIRTYDNAVIDTLPGGITDMAFSPDGQYLYGCSPGEGLIFTIRTSDNIPVAVLEVGFEPFGLAVHPSGRLLYVSDNSSDTVSVICIPENVFVKGNLRVFNGPTYIVPSLNGEYMYVLHSNDPAVGVIGFSQKIVE